MANGKLWNKIPITYKDFFGFLTFHSVPTTLIKRLVNSVMLFPLDFFRRLPCKDTWATFDLNVTQNP